MGAQAQKYSVSSLQFYMMCLFWLSPVPGACIVLYFLGLKLTVHSEMALDICWFQCLRLLHAEIAVRATMTNCFLISTYILRSP